MAWRRIGIVTISPTTDKAVVGPIEVPGFDGVEVRVRLLSGPYPFQYGYGLLYYRSSNGREMGTIRVYPKMEPEDYIIGKGMTVQDTTGELVFEPRTWNLRWVKAGFSLVVEILADLASDIPTDRYQASGFTDGLAELVLTQVGDLGHLIFLP